MSFKNNINNIREDIYSIDTSEDTKKQILENEIKNRLSVSLDNYNHEVDVNIAYLNYRNADKVRKYIEKLYKNKSNKEQLCQTPN